MSIFDDMLAPIYAAVADTTVTRADGTTFAATLGNADGDVFDIRTGNPTLRAPAALGLVEGERVVIASRAYLIASPPEAILDGAEVTARLQEVEP